jgi:hypothetical protein
MARRDRELAHGKRLANRLLEIAAELEAQAAALARQQPGATPMADTQGCHHRQNLLLPLSFRCDEARRASDPDCHGLRPQRLC